MLSGAHCRLPERLRPECSDRCSRCGKQFETDCNVRYTYIGHWVRGKVRYVVDVVVEHADICPV